MEMRDVVGYEDYYGVTDDGRVWSKRSHTYLKQQSKGRRGDLSVGLSKGGVCKHYLVHRLVCFAFHGNPPDDGYEVDHINALVWDNRAENLRWVTPEENKVHYYEMNEAIMRPIVGFNEYGDVLHFDNPSAARDAGFPSVHEVLSQRTYLTNGYAFVYEDEWPLPIGVYFEQMEDLRVRRERKRAEETAETNTLPVRLRGLSIDDGSIVEFPTFKAAAEAGYKSVRSCLKGELMTCGRRVWFELGEYTVRKTKPGAGRKPAQVRLIGTSLEDGSTVEFNSFKETREAGFPAVRDCIVGKTRTCGGYTWEAPDGYEPRKYNKGVA